MGFYFCYLVSVIVEILEAGALVLIVISFVLLSRIEVSSDLSATDCGETPGELLLSVWWLLLHNVSLVCCLHNKLLYRVGYLCLSVRVDIT